MFDALLIVAVLSGGLSALMGGRSSLALLCGLGAQELLCAVGAPFVPVAWMVIDLWVIAAIVTPVMTRRDCFVIGLFAPAWALYFVAGWDAYNASALIVSAQLLLSCRPVTQWHRLRETFARLAGKEPPLSFVGAAHVG